MKTVVHLDLFACMILPASTVYAVYLIFLVAAGKTQFSLLLLVLCGMIIGVQIGANVGHDSLASVDEDDDRKKNLIEDRPG